MNCKNFGKKILKRNDSRIDGAYTTGKHTRRQGISGPFLTGNFHGNASGKTGGYDNLRKRR